MQSDCNAYIYEIRYLEWFYIALRRIYWSGFLSPSGGTLKIYGNTVNPDVPYKTLLLSATDNVAHVVRETLDKYGLEKEDPDRFCLVQVRQFALAQPEAFLSGQTLL